jgi:DNA (cytosine-5)-methyltransferase 1
MNVLDLFSGIGGFSIGLEKAGFKTVAFCEIEPFPRSVLKKHWPTIPVYEDVKTLSAKRLRTDGITVDVICGGFPCQDISLAGKGAGLSGERSGLWFEFHRLIKEIRPKYIIAENVSALRSRGLDQVLWSLNEIGYDAEWHCIPASAVGAPHQRDRIWIVAYPRREYGQEGNISNSTGKTESIWGQKTNYFERCSKILAYSYSTQCEEGGLSSGTYAEYANIISGSRWEIEPDVGRVANGLPNRSHRLRALGNAVVPQIPEIIGRAIINAPSH